MSLVTAAETDDHRDFDRSSGGDDEGDHPTTVMGQFATALGSLADPSATFAHLKRAETLLGACADTVHARQLFGDALSDVPPLPRSGERTSNPQVARAAALEALEDVATRDLVLLAADAFLAEAVSRSCSSAPRAPPSTSGPGSSSAATDSDPVVRRVVVVRQLQSIFRRYLALCHGLRLLSPDDATFLQTSTGWDPASGPDSPNAEGDHSSSTSFAPKVSADARRQLKIARFKASRSSEAQLRDYQSRLAHCVALALRARRKPVLPADVTAAILPAVGIAVDGTAEGLLDNAKQAGTASSASSPLHSARLGADRHSDAGASGASAGADDDEDEEVLARAFALLLAQHLAGKAVDELASLHDEALHLRRMLREAPRTPPGTKRNEESADDRLDTQALRSALPAAGPLLSARGKPLRPFTITSSRQQMADRVFRPGHRLPTMSIDEYIQSEMARGGILPAVDANAVNPNEEEEDEDRDEAADCKTYKDREWDSFTDDNPRGWGNRGGNRG